MPAPSVAVIDEWFKYLIGNEDLAVDLIVYLKTSPEVVSEERTVSFEYIKALHDIHEDWLYHKRLHQCPASVIVINADLDVSSIEEEYEKYKPHILNRLPSGAQMF
ncbi:hypothetical protein NQ318_019406 [Aromia moschata]|uniref:Deoxynucleoside kinase domain-containing protein n=1 Tax=Aromia moschata TaxID=1265417 RepID=A0AAV8XDR4_9CUCU|nr:hypothetical protein NQ318_019406 [Aromia moschata]